MLKKLVLKNRSYRRFDASHALSGKTLTHLVGLARLAPCAANIQPLKYFISYKAKTNDLIFPNLFWAGYLNDWEGPAPKERPTGYIIILQDKNIAPTMMGADQGIAAQTMLLGAVEKGLGGCIIGSINKESLKEQLHLPSHLEILLVVALGKPAEKVEICDLPEPGNIRYWRDEKGVHRVPKRKIEDLILNLDKE